MKKIFHIFIFIFSYVIGIGQIAIDTSYFYQDTLTGYYFPKKKVLISEIMTNSAVFKTNQYYSFQKGPEFTMDNIKFTRFDQYYNGVKINGNSYFVSSSADSSNADSIIHIGGKVLSNQLPVPPSIISANTAIQSLTLVLNCFKYKWEDPNWEARIKEIKDDANATNFPFSQLEIYKMPSQDFDLTNEYYYAYPIYISALKNSQDSVYFDSIYYVSAVNGNILKRFAAFQTSFSNKNFQNKYSFEKQEFHTDFAKTESNPPSNFSSSSCNATCKSGGVTVHYYGGQTIYMAEFNYLLVCNNRLKDNCNGATLYTQRRGSNNWEDYRSTNNSWPNPNDKVGITGHWCLEKAYEAYKNLFGFNSFNNNYSQVNLIIDNQGVTRWSESEDAIYVGLFKSTSSYQAVLDIVGHEFGHGVMNNSSGIGSSGMDLSSLTALNMSADENVLAEGFGDIFGQMVEYYVNGNYSTATSSINDFVHGGNNPSGFQCDQTRSLINPSQTCNPNTMFGPNWLPPLTLSNNELDFDDLIHQNSTVLSHWFYLLAQGGIGTNGVGNAYCVKAIGQNNAGKIAFLAATNYIANYNRNLFGARLATIQAAKQLFGNNSHEAAQVTAAWYAVGVGANFTGQIDVKNITVNAPSTSYNYNSKVSLQNVTVNNGGVFYASSNTEVEVLPDFNANSGSFADLYIGGPICVGSARYGNSSQGKNANDNNSEMATQAVTQKEQTNLINTSFLVMPNPTSGNFKLQLDNSLEYPKQIAIRDVLGRIVTSIENPDSFEYEFSLSGEKDGVYIVLVYYSDNVLSRRIIKN